jgi:hypothetical protein
MFIKLNQLLRSREAGKDTHSPGEVRYYNPNRITEIRDYKQEDKVLGSVIIFEDDYAIECVQKVDEVLALIEPMYHVVPKPIPSASTEKPNQTQPIPK